MSFLTLLAAAVRHRSAHRHDTRNVGVTANKADDLGHIPSRLFHRPLLPHLQRRRHILFHRPAPESRGGSELLARPAGPAGYLLSIVLPRPGELGTDSGIRQYKLTGAFRS